MKEYLRVCDNTYTTEELLETESRIITTLEFRITQSSSLRYLERYARVAGLGPRDFSFARYLLELSLMEYEIIKFKNSHISASVVYLVMKIFQTRSSSEDDSTDRNRQKYQEWSQELELDTGYTLTEVRTCAKELYIFLYKSDGFTLNAVRRKFSTKQYQEVSKYKIQFRNQIR